MEDKEQHSTRDMLHSALLFSAGYKLKDSVYLRKYGLNKKHGAALGAAFALIPALIKDDDDDTAKLGAVGFMTALALNKKALRRTFANNTEMFEGTLKTMKVASEKQQDLKKWFIEARQRVFREGEFQKGYIKGVKELSSEFLGVVKGNNNYKRSKAYIEYEKVSDSLKDMSLDDFRRMGKKIPFEYYDYYFSRKTFDHEVGLSNLGSGFLTSAGYFSKVEDGKLKLDAAKFLKEDANYVSDKISFLDSIPKMFTGNKENLKEYIENKNKNYSFFYDVLDSGKVTRDNEVTYKEFMTKHGESIKKELGDKVSKYFDKDGKAKYLDILGNQKFSDNLLINEKTSDMVDMTWFKSKNYALDLVKGAESSFRAFFKNSPLGGKTSQFPLLDFLGIDSKLHKSIHGDKLKNFYIVNEDNIDLKRTLSGLERQISTYRKVGDEKWRKKHGYKSISQALYNINKTGDNIYSAKINNLEDLNNATRLLEFKRTQVLDGIEKTGGILKKSPMYGIKIDAAHKKYYIEKGSDNNFALLEKTQDKINAVFYNNKALVRDGGDFIQLAGDFKLDFSKGTKILQAKKDGGYYTTGANRAGKYIERENTPMPFKFDHFKNLYENREHGEALRYLKKSDLNFLPGFGNTAFKENDNFLEGNLEAIDNLKTYLKVNKLTGDKSTYLEMAALLTGAEKQTKQFQKHFKNEVDDTFNIALEKYNKGLNELKGHIESDTWMKNKFKKFTNDKQLKNIDKNLDLYTSNEIKDILGEKLTQTEDIKNFFKIKDSFERTADKFKLVNEYKSINDIEFGENFIKNKRGKLFDNSNVKEDIIINTFNKGKNYDEFEEIFGEKLEDNLLFHKESLFHKNRVLNVNLRSPAITKYWGTDVDFDKSKNIENLFNDTTAMSNNVSLFFTKGIESFENSLETLGIPKLSPYNVGSSARYLGSMLTKRILPAYALYGAYQTANSFVDMILPDSTPIFGQGITAAAFEAMAHTRMATQVLINGVGMGAVFRKMEEMFPGMLTDNGLLSPLQLSATNEEMRDQLYNGKEVVVKKNRFWYSSGRQMFEGGETEEIRPHLLYLGQQRTSGIYRNKIERFFRDDFIPTKLAWTLVDPYMEERINQDIRPVAKSKDLFDDIPIVGGFMNATVGQIIKPTKYFNKEEWFIEDGVMLNPNYDGQENTLKYIEYDNSSRFSQAVNTSIDELSNMMGMRGYLLGQAKELLFGRDKEKVGLETLDDGYRIQDRYEQLKLGGMFGLTEPIRRMLPTNHHYETVNPLRNNSMPDWMPTNYFKNRTHGNIYNELSFGEFILPGETYKKYNKLHSDELGEYGLVDRLKILSIVAPYSKEYRHYKREALSKLDELDEERKQVVYQSLSYEAKHKDRNIREKTAFDADVTNLEVEVRSQESPLEFIGSDNRRYRLAGLSMDYTDGRADSSITSELSTLSNFLQKGAVLNGVVNKDAVSAVKTDNQGEYIELYVPDFDVFENLKENHYLRHSNNGDLSLGTKLFDLINNAKKPNYLEKAFGSKDTLHRYYYENILDPSFKDWGSPIESFISPLIDTAANGGLKGYIGSMNISMKMGDFGDPLMPALTTLSYVKGTLFGDNEIDRITREDDIKNRIEYAKHLSVDNTYKGNFNSSIYDISEYDGLSKVKNYLTMTEKKYLDNIVNEIDPEVRQQIYDTSTDRMKIVLGHLWQKQSNFNGGTYEKENIQLPTFDEEIPEYFGTNDPNYNDALFKYKAGFDLEKFEERTLQMYGVESQLKEWKSKDDLSRYIERIMKHRGNYSQRVLSTIMPSDMVIFDKNDEYVNI